jgi:hypothetical protein
MPDNTNPIPLDRETETYRRELPRLLAGGQAGRFALIKGGDIIGTWDNQGEALEAGRQRFGLEPIAVKKIDPRDVDLLARMDAAAKGTACPS